MKKYPLQTLAAIIALMAFFVIVFAMSLFIVGAMSGEGMPPEQEEASCKMMRWSTVSELPAFCLKYF